MARPLRVSNRPRGSRRETVVVDGFADLYRQLEVNLPKATSRAVLQRAGKIAMQPVRDRIEAAAPVRSGQTRDSVRVTVRFLKAVARFGAAIVVQVGVGSKDVFWPRFSERGTVKEPARPFVRPNFDAEVGAIVERLKLAIGAEMLKSVARRARRIAKRS